MTRTTAVAEYLYVAGWRPTPHHHDAWNDPTTGDRYELREALTLQTARDTRALLHEHPTTRAPRIHGRGRA
jgi:hypothetical protein